MKKNNKENENENTTRTKETTAEPTAQQYTRHQENTKNLPALRIDAMPAIKRVFALQITRYELRLGDFVVRHHFNCAAQAGVIQTAHTIRCAGVH